MEIGNPIPFNLPAQKPVSQTARVEDVPNAHTAISPAPAGTQEGQADSAGTAAATAEPAQTVELLASDEEPDGAHAEEETTGGAIPGTDPSETISEPTATNAEVSEHIAYTGNLTYEDLLALQQEEGREEQLEQEGLAAYEATQQESPPPSPTSSVLSYMTDPEETENAQAAPATTAGNAQTNGEQANHGTGTRVGDGEDGQEGGDVEMEGQDDTTTNTIIIVDTPTTAAHACQSPSDRTNLTSGTQNAFPTPREAYGTGRDPQGTPRPPLSSTPKTSQRPRIQTPAARLAASAAAARRLAPSNTPRTTVTRTTPNIQATRNPATAFTFGTVTFNPTTSVTRTTAPTAHTNSTTANPSSAGAIIATPPHAQTVTTQSAQPTTQNATQAATGHTPGALGAPATAITTTEGELDADGDVTMVDEEEPKEKEVIGPKLAEEDTPIPPPRTDLTAIPKGNKAPKAEIAAHIARSLVGPTMCQKIDEKAARGYFPVLIWPEGRTPVRSEGLLVNAANREILERHAFSNASVVPAPTNKANITCEIEGDVAGPPPHFYVAYLRAGAQRDRLLGNVALNTADSSLFVLSWELPPVKTVLTLTSRYLGGLPNIPTIVARILEEFRSAFRACPTIRECVRRFHDGVWKAAEVDEARVTCILESIIDSFHIDVADSNSSRTDREWTVRWTRPPTRDVEGERIFLNAIRKLKIKSEQAILINENTPTLTFCGVCHGTNHSVDYCPFHKIEGWRTPTNDSRAHGSETNRGRGHGGRGGRGGRGRGRGSQRGG